MTVIVPALERMIVLDYIIANEDRHFNNFGLLRNADTLEWLGAAPIYDSGTSLWYDTATVNISSSDVLCKPFKKKHSEQLKLVSSFDWLDISKLDDIENKYSFFLYAGGIHLSVFYNELKHCKIKQKIYFTQNSARQHLTFR